ncbi:hypothetical protein EGM51_13355 [Verrucomicrobia bacterium S94]|nr:hypothetical protein EGM51_13355 [Verrucomicrobia bacterium S94]
MRGHIIIEDRFMHQGIDHHLFVTKADGAEHEYRFEVRRTAPGADQPETIYEKIEDLAARIEQDPNAEIGHLLCSKLSIIKKDVFTEEDLRANDP